MRQRSNTRGIQGSAGKLSIPKQRRQGGPYSNAAALATMGFAHGTLSEPWHFYTHRRHRGSISHADPPGTSIPRGSAWQMLDSHRQRPASWRFPRRTMRGTAAWPIPSGQRRHPLIPIAAGGTGRPPTCTLKGVHSNVAAPDPRSPIQDTSAGLSSSRIRRHPGRV